MKILIASFLFGFSSFTALQAKDYSFIKKLPHRLAEADKEGHKGWDTGNTGMMHEATYRFNDTLVTMIEGLVKNYYPDGYFPASRTSDYVTALYTMERFKEDASDPAGDSRGTEANLDIAVDVSRDLEDTISKMVEAITADDATFDQNAWKREWEKSVLGKSNK